MRANYIDVMNPGNKKTTASVPGPDMFNTLPQAAVPQNLFIPAPSKFYCKLWIDLG